MSSGGFPLSRDGGRAQGGVGNEYVDSASGLDRQRQQFGEFDTVSPRHADDLPRSKGRRAEFIDDRFPGGRGGEEGTQETSYTRRGRVAPIIDDTDPDAHELPTSVRRPGRNGVGPLSPEVRHLAYRINATQTQAARDRAELRRAAQTIDMMVESFQDAKQRGVVARPEQAPTRTMEHPRAQSQTPQVDSESTTSAFGGKRILFHLLAGCTMLLLSGIIVRARHSRTAKRSLDEMQAPVVQPLAVPAPFDSGAGLVNLFDYDIHTRHH